MSGKTKLKKNLTYQTIYQILNTCIPLITSPYLARVLGASQQGVFSYTQSIVNYFTLFALLGVANYGTRTIAACGEEKKKRSNVFWNIYSFQIVTSLVAIIAYALYWIFFCNENEHIAILQGFYLLGSLVDVSWLFFGCEKFDVTVKRSIIIRLLSLIGILTLVKSTNDLWIYTLIMAGGTFISNWILWVRIGTLVDLHGFKYISAKEAKTYIKPNIVLFVPLLAMTVFHVMDKTMLGLFSTYEETGYYYNADKVINIPISIINGVSTVMLPRMSALAQEGKKDEADKLFNLSLEAIVLVSSALAFGIAGISKEFTPLFFGKGFEPCIYLIICLAPVLIVKSLSQTSRMQYLIPNHKERIFVQSVFSGAIINFIVNLILISRIGALGAVIGTLVAEIATCCWQYYKMRELVAYSKAMIRSMIYVVFGMVMFLVVRIVAVLPINRLINLGIEIMVGGSVFLLLCIGYWKISRNPLMSVVLKRKNRGD